MDNCCNHRKTSKKCKRSSDNKVFSLPRRFTKKKCKKGINVSGIWSISK